jgi:UDP-N-acetylglucosamine 2-epimerase (non-hydrolysing)
VPCLTIRPNTERPITVTQGTNRLVTPEAVVDEARRALADGRVAPPDPPPLWDGRAGERIARIVARWLDEPR